MIGEHDVLRYLLRTAIPHVIYLNSSPFQDSLVYV